MRIIKFAQLLILMCYLGVNAFAQLELGRATMTYAAAKPLLRTDAIASALNNVRFLRAVGGVAFDKIAVPASGLNISSLDLKYVSTAEDGKRLKLTLNGQQIETDLHDWELVPIAKHANSNNFSCFTLFGELQDETATVDKNSRILNYSPEFFNTLLGLRLFQLDILIVEPELSIHLPKKNNEYIVGPGELVPDTTVNRIGWENFSKELRNVFEDYSSYLICDENRTISFEVVNNHLKLYSTPFYHFWRFSYRDENGNLSKDALEEVSKNIVTESENIKDGDLKDWYISKILELDQKNRSIIDKVKEDAKSEYESIMNYHQILAELRLTEIANAIYVRNLSLTLSDQPHLFRNINPVVWDAGVKTMQYGAFFRYCKQNFPEQWKVFMAQIKRIIAFPIVKTPTILNLPSR